MAYTIDFLWGTFDVDMTYEEYATQVIRGKLSDIGFFVDRNKDNDCIYSMYPKDNCIKVLNLTPKFEKCDYKPPSNRIIKAFKSSCSNMGIF